MRPTRASTLLLAVLLAAPVGWTIARIVDATGTGLPATPWATAGLLAFLALLLLVSARTVHGWIHERRYDGRMSPLLASRLLLLGKAAAVCGAVTAGGYLGLALAVAGAGVDPARTVRPMVTALAAVGVAAAGVVLERACRVPPRTPDDRDGLA